MLFIIFPVSCKSGKKEAEKNMMLNATRISDGDSFEGRGDAGTFRIRLYGIDAPEMGQDFSRKSKETLGDLCKSGPLKVVVINKDRYGRLVSNVYNSKGQFINQIMVAEGMAWHFKKFSSDPVLDNLEKEARQSRKGLWGLENPLPPWDYRKDHRRE